VRDDRRYLLIALGLLGTFMLGEVITAVLSGSLALLSGAAGSSRTLSPRPRPVGRHKPETTSSLSRYAAA
jgi:hypothetical protein